ncbi:MAG TPA: DISARM system helicase DrmA [Verrucomicrobiota bacterium]|nr:DISARM system helicase DrmA [Verrucomicrobiota bacterium]
MNESTIAPPSAIRDELEKLVLGDLHGPAGGLDEELDEASVSERYLVGMLAPKRNPAVVDLFDELAVGGKGTDEEGKVDIAPPQAESLIPSSFGLTFAVSADAKALKITARWGHYLRTDSETLTNEKGNPKKVWKRTQRQGVSDPIPLVPGPMKNWVVIDDQPEVIVRGLIRKNAGDWIVTLFLVNGQKEQERLNDEQWLFQPELLVESADGSAAFVKRSHFHDPQKADPVSLSEERMMAMAYRHQSEFAVGHNVAVHAEPSPDDPARALRISTRSVPVYDVPMQTPPTKQEIPALSDLVLDMKALAESKPGDLPAKLKALPEAYAAWIEARNSDSDPTLKEFANEKAAALKNCDRALKRICEGIDLLTSNPMAAEAFRFANEAMWLQRIHTILAEQVRRGVTANMAAIDVEPNRSWYPFQLAFILLNLPGITDLKHPDRTDETGATADLLWFPTGGGKTEAYLGLTAYTLGLRRLQGEVAERPAEYGVAVLMRYTLRLLTLQQFQRASALICACESIRRDRLVNGDKRLGAEPFRVGLWVGQRTTPNTTAQSEESIKQDHGHYSKGSMAAGSGSPAQLKNCPWCGKSVDAGKDIVVESFSSGRGRTIQYCSDLLGQCLFSRAKSPGEGIPVMVVDDEIYRKLPSLLIATVDKFAQMPWKGETQMLFGQVNGVCPRHGFRSPEIDDTLSHNKRGDLPAVQTQPHTPLRPPDLIIQDELHLISGPLGTLVGLYETAVDELAAWIVDGKRVRPKVIASTATIRRAASQVQQLFLRKVDVFPPQGTDVRDNFFSVQRPPSEQFPGRRYFGICAPGKRIKTGIIRVYVAHLAAAQKLYEKYGKHSDPWMTMVGYFNSLRELGGARRLVDDSVRSLLRETVRRGLANRKRPLVKELTSRMGATDIPDILDLLEVGFDPDDDKARKEMQKSGKQSDKPFPIDVLLATNMVSVGVDVKRLGLMVVAGQPKTTAEYIQATSRVGRSRPGLVCTLYNWARPRDLSHYERFEHYHATFYQHVEGLSVTPFAARALDRGLSALLVALVRLAGEKFNPNAAAAILDRSHAYVKRAIDQICKRAVQVDGRKEVGDAVKAMLNQRIDLWLAQAQRPTGGNILGYQKSKDGLTPGLLQRAGLGPWELFTCLTSLREVEPTVGLILDDRGLDQDYGPKPTEDAGKEKVS